MKRALASSLVSSLTLGALLAGCSASTASSDPSQGATAPVTAPAGTRVAPVAVTAKSSRVRMMADALSSVPLGDDQRAEIERLASDSDARHLAAAAARSAIMVAIAAQVEAGQLDRGALQPKIDAAADAANAAHPADQAALQRLHDLLTPDQRGAVADAIATHRKAEHAERSHSRTARLDRWTADLQLTAPQRAQIALILAAQRGEHHGHDADFKAHDHGERGRGFLDSFRSDTLTLRAPEDAHVHANAMADHFMGLAQAVLPILTAEQRSLAAAKLRERAAAGAGNEDAPLTE
jgi:hypothetical protein